MTQPERHPDVELIPAADGYVVRVPGSDLLTWLNRTAAMVFLLCTGENTPEHIAGAVRHAFQLFRDPSADVARTLDALAQAGLVTGAPALELEAAVLIAVWAPSTSWEREVHRNLERVTEQLESVGIRVRTVIDPEPTRAVAHNMACTAVVTTEHYSHVLLLSATAAATSAAADADLVGAISSAEPFVGVPVRGAQPNWSRLASFAAGRALSAQQCETLAYEFNVTFEGLSGERRRLPGFAQARFVGSDAVLLSRDALVTLAGSTHVTRYRGRIDTMMIERLQHVWGFFDPLESATGLAVIDDVAFCERWKATGGQVIVSRSGQFGESIRVSAELLAKS